MITNPDDKKLLTKGIADILLEDAPVHPQGQNQQEYEALNAADEILEYVLQEGHSQLLDAAFNYLKESGKEIFVVPLEASQSFSDWIEDVREYGPETS